MKPAAAHYEFLAGNATLPAECEQRRRVACELVNALYAVGGSVLVALIWALAGALLAVPALNALVRPRQLR
jgi:hypothetical protein